VLGGDNRPRSACDLLDSTRWSNWHSGAEPQAWEHVNLVQHKSRCCRSPFRNGSSSSKRRPAQAKPKRASCGPTALSPLVSWTGCILQCPPARRLRSFTAASLKCWDAYTLHFLAASCAQFLVSSIRTTLKMLGTSRRRLHGRWDQHAASWERPLRSAQSTKRCFRNCA
jgi:hypothetical protein